MSSFYRSPLLNQRKMGPSFWEHIGAEVAQAGDASNKIPICRRAKNAMQKWRRSLQIDSVSRIYMDWTDLPPYPWVPDTFSYGMGRGLVGDGTRIGFELYVAP